MSDPVELTLQFEPPVEAEDLRDRFQTLADEMDALVEDQPDDQEPEIRCDGGVRTDDVTTRHTVEQFRREDEACLLTDGAGPEERPPLHAGDHVQDRDNPDAPMVVVAVSPHAAHEYRLEGTSKTVAEVNEAYPANDDVVEAVYPDRDDDDLAALKRYAFPRSRLELVTPVHDRDDEQEGSDA